MKRLLVAGGIAVAGIVLVVSVGLRGAFEPADAFVDRWLQAVSGDGSADRGWSQLDESSRQRFGNDAEAFRAAAAAHDWSGFRWDVESSHKLESWLSYVYIAVEGGFGETPAFLRDNRLVAPWCLDDDAPGISLAVVREWLFSEMTLGPGGLTGSSELALSAGACAAAPPPEDQQFQPGGDFVWAGHALEVWNWTRLPLSLVGEDGHRVDLPPCQKVGLDDVARQFEVRAATGYVATFGLEILRAVTTYVVIGSKDLYVNNAPPLEPMPPCEGKPQVQQGV